MITSIFIYVIASLMIGFTAILPSPETLPAGLDNALTTLGTSIQGLSGIIPFDTVSVMFTLAITIQISIVGWRGTRWLLNMIRSSGA